MENSVYYSHRPLHTCPSCRCSFFQQKKNLHFETSSAKQNSYSLIRINFHYFSPAREKVCEKKEGNQGNKNRKLKNINLQLPIKKPTILHKNKKIKFEKAQGVKQNFTNQANLQKIHPNSKMQIQQLSIIESQTPKMTPHSSRRYIKSTQVIVPIFGKMQNKKIQPLSTINQSRMSHIVLRV